MPERPQPVPPGFHTLTPHLIVRDAARAITFYENAFGAQLLGKMLTPDGKVMHAAMKVGDSMLMLNDEFPEWGALSPVSSGGSGVTLHMYLENVDAAFQKAVSAGAEVKMPVMDQFWGDRYGIVADPFGHKWSLATHIRDVSQEDMALAQTEAMAKMPKSA
jgi:PhnB protein